MPLIHTGVAPLLFVLLHQQLRAYSVGAVAFRLTRDTGYVGSARGYCCTHSCDELNISTENGGRCNL